MSLGSITQNHSCDSSVSLAALWPELSNVGSAPFETEGSPNREKMLSHMMQQHALEKSGWSRTLSATIALLRSAHTKLNAMEKIISQKDLRIKKLEALVTTDELTGLQNRRGIFHALGCELDRARRGISPGGVLVMIDLDNFKMINDRYGHQAGDACLRLVGQTALAQVRRMDIAGRLGGDEFILLLSSTTKEKAVGRIQQFAWQLNNLSLAWKGDIVPVRASLGLHAFSGEDKLSRIIAVADERLYKAKKRRKEDINYQDIITRISHTA